MKLIRETAFCAIDCESAGALRGATDEPVQIGWAGMTGTRIDPETFFMSYLRASCPIVWTARKVHGITDAHLEGAPAMMDLWPRVRESLTGKIIVAHSSGTEKRFLRAFPFHGFGPWLDSLQLARRVIPGLGDYTLGGLVGRLALTDEVTRLCPGGRWHDALFDAVASLVIVRHVVVTCGLEDHPVEALLG